MENNESSGAGYSANSVYLLDNAGREASARFAALAAIYDPGTIRHLEGRGVTSLMTLADNTPAIRVLSSIW